jgi:hypothetical protein
MVDWGWGTAAVLPLCIAAGLVAIGANEQAVRYSGVNPGAVFQPVQKWLMVHTAVL